MTALPTPTNSSTAPSREEQRRQALIEWTRDAVAYAEQVRNQVDQDEWHVDVPTEFQPVLDQFLATFDPTPPTPVQYRQQTDAERRASATGDITALTAFITSPHLPILVNLLPKPDRPTRGGRPSMYPDWVLLAFDALACLAGSISAATRELRDGYWDIVKAAGNTAGFDTASLLEAPPRRHHLRYLIEKRVDSNVLAQYGLALAVNGVWTARKTGALIPTGRPDLANPHRPNVICHDGKAKDTPVKPKANPPVDRETGEILRHRVDPACGLYREGGDDSDRWVWGTKFGFVSCRTPQANQRVYLGVHHVTAGRGYNTESSNAVSLMTTINEIAAATSPYGHQDTGIHAVANDAAMAGTHLDTLHHRLGVPVFVPTKKAAEDSTRYIEHDGKRYKAYLLPAVHCGRRTHRIWAAAGGFWLETRRDNGTTAYQALQRVTRRQRSGNKWLLTATVTVPCRHGDHTVNQRVDRTTVDSVTGFNRGEHLRWHDEHSETHKRVYAMRADTESGNAQYEDAFYRNKTPAFGARKQTFHTIIWCLLQNVKALLAFERNPARIT